MKFRSISASRASTMVAVVAAVSLGAYCVALSERIARVESAVALRNEADPLDAAECAHARGPCMISFARLISAPQQFQNRSVMVEGYYAGALEASAFYESRTALSEARRDKIWLSGAILRAQPDGPVTVIGTFKRGPAGHMHEYAGEIIVSELLPVQAQ